MRLNTYFFLIKTLHLLNGKLNIDYIYLQTDLTIQNILILLANLIWLCKQEYTREQELINSMQGPGHTGRDGEIISRNKSPFSRKSIHYKHDKQLYVQFKI